MTQNITTFPRFDDDAVPRRLPELLADPDAATAARVMKAMTMIDVAALEQAAAG